MVDAVPNIVNPNMKLPPLDTGVVGAPDTLHKPILYSHVQAGKDFNKLDSDIYDGVNSSKPLNKKKAPKSLLYIAGLILTGVLALKFKKFFKK